MKLLGLGHSNQSGLDAVMEVTTIANVPYLVLACNVGYRVQ